MLKPNQWVTMRWHPKNIPHYTALGYQYTKTGDEFLVRVEDLPLQSHVTVTVICDYCGEEYTYKYQNYNNKCSQHLGDACPKCKYIKNRKSVQERYGVDCVLQRPEIKAKIQNTLQKKYGVTHYSKTKEYRQKCRDTYLAHLQDGSIQAPSSSQQVAIYEMLNQLYGNGELNYPCGRCLLDCMVEVDGIKIDVEYDGIFWHQGKEDYDRRRNYFVINQGYKVLRIKGKHKVPDQAILQSSIDTLVHEDLKFLEIQIE